MQAVNPFPEPGIPLAILQGSERADRDEKEGEMREPVIKFKPVHWWIALIAILLGVILFFALHKHAY